MSRSDQDQDKEIQSQVNVRLWSGQGQVKGRSSSVQVRLDQVCYGQIGLGEIMSRRVRSGSVSRRVR